jgi:hypothetical protein
LNSINYLDSKIRDNDEKWQLLSILDNYLIMNKDHQHIVKINETNHKDVGRNQTRKSREAGFDNFKFQALEQNKTESIR